MTSGHLFFIPSIFFIGFFVGAAISNWLSRKKIERRGVVLPPKTRGSFLASTFVLFSVIFIATHIVPFFGGAKSLHATLGHQPLFDQHPSSTAGEVYDRLESYGETGRVAYKRFTFSGDVIFPASLLVFLFVLANFVRERTSLSGALPSILISAPVAWFLSDMLENSVIYFLLSNYPQKYLFLAEQLATITNFKFALLLGSITLPAVSYVFFRNKGQAAAL